MDTACTPVTEVARLQDFTACLGLLGPVLDILHMAECKGQLFTADSMRALWACPRLCRLYMRNCFQGMDAEGVEDGLRNLRFAATNPLTSVPTSSRSAW